MVISHFTFVSLFLRLVLKHICCSFSGSPWTVAVIDPKSFNVTGDGLYLCHTNKKASFNINNKGEINQSFLHLKISGKMVER